jgi:hypothetical protein|tara:strand:+ start:1023 stop:1448 length:426 start_codon:yes stop_codon:yes gene_type:complete
MNHNQVDDLLDALENESNSSIINLTTKKIKEQKNNVLQQIQLPREKLKLYHKKLKDYRYCTDLKDIQYGFYIRWIPLKDPENMNLTNGAIICDVKLVNGQLHVLCKNRGRMMQIKFDEVLIFQKLSEQERVILSILDYLDN